MKLLGCFILCFIGCSVFCQNKQNFFSFDVNNNKISVELDKQSDSLFHLNLFVNDSLHSAWSLDYPVYHFDYGNVTGDEKPEIAVGVIKATRYDPKPDKRLFIFRITDDYYIRPLWLGSRVSHPLETFCILKEENSSLIRTVEKEQNGAYLVAEYKWRGFGLEHVQYIHREINKEQAIEFLQVEN